MNPEELEILDAAICLVAMILTVIATSLLIVGVFG